MDGIYIWLWIILANAGAIIALSVLGGDTSAMGERLRRPAEPEALPPEASRPRTMR